MACDSYTVLMIHADGADGSTSFPDSSNSAHTVTANGDAQNDTAQFAPLVGSTASALFDGTNDFLETAASSDWAFGTGAFTIDFWIRFAATGDNALVDVNGGNAAGYTLELQSGTNLAWTDAGAGRKTESWGPSTGVWYHLAVVQTGGGSGSMYFFIDGTQLGSPTSTNTDLNDTTHVLRIGTFASGIRDFNGWIDEFRISKGIARWTANFTPPTVEYCVGGGATRTPRMMLLGAG